MKENIRKKLYEEVAAGLSYTEELTNEDLYQRIDEIILREGRQFKLSNVEKQKYRELIFASFRRLDILSVLMDDEEITEIMVNGHGKIFVEKHGKIELFDGSFTEKNKLEDIIQKIASAVNRRVNEATPMADARLEDGSRVNLVLPPIALDGPVVTIRRFPKEPLTMEDLISLDTISKEAASFLQKLVCAGYNIFISGGTGAGKTTFLGALAEYIPSDERVITIEDSAELRLTSIRNLVRLESRPPNLEGQYGISIRALLRNSLRMRPDRILVGEIRSEEALDMLQAMNTGHDGSMSTGHANSAQDMISRIETMVLMGKDLPLQAIRSQIASGIDIFIHLNRLRDRTRRVTGIYQVTGIKKGEVHLEPLFVFRETKTEGSKIRGEWVRTDQELLRTEKWKRTFGE